MTEFAHLGTAPGEAWRDWRSENAVDCDGLLEIERERFPTYRDTDVAHEVGPDDDRIVDLDVDPCGELYLLLGSGVVQRLTTDGPRRLRCLNGTLVEGEPRALFVGESTIYLGEALGTADSGDSSSSVEGGGSASNGTDGGTSPRGRLSALSRETRQLRWRRTVADGTPVAIDADDTARYVLLAGDGGGRLSRISPDGTVRPVVESYDAPRDLAIHCGVATVLDSAAGATVLRRSETAGLDPGTPVQAPGGWGPALSETVRSLAGESADSLLVGRDEAGLDEATLLRVEQSAVSEVVTLPGGARTLSRSALLYVLSADGTAVHPYEPERRIARNDRTDGYDASLSRRFDAGERGVQWHRVTAGFSRSGPECQVHIAYAASDDPDDPAPSDWHTIEPANPHDALLEDARGRYLWLRIELSGSERSSPTLAAVRAYFPRQTYLRYLPELFAEDPESRAFLEQFLSIFESTFADATEEFEGLTRYLDPDGIPPEYLGWLEDWLALSTDETWPPAARRALLDRAPELFRQRGTVAGLLAVLGLYVEHVEDRPPGWSELIERQIEAAERRAGTDGSPADAGAVRRRIERSVHLLEYADLDCAPDAAREPFERLLGCPQCFFVFVRPFVTDEQFRTVQRLVDEYRPAHAVGTAVRLDPSIVLGGHAYLGTNTVLADRDLVVGDGELGRDSVLEEREDAGQLEVRSRLGVDSTL